MYECSNFSGNPSHRHVSFNDILSLRHRDVELDDEITKLEESIRKEFENLTRSSLDFKENVFTSFVENLHRVMTLTRNDVTGQQKHETEMLKEKLTNLTNDFQEFRVNHTAELTEIKEMRENIELLETKCDFVTSLDLKQRQVDQSLERLRRRINQSEASLKEHQELFFRSQTQFVEEVAAIKQNVFWNSHDIERLKQKPMLSCKTLFIFTVMLSYKTCFVFKYSRIKHIKNSYALV